MYRSQRNKLAWLAASRPDVMVARKIFGQKTSTSFNIEKIKDINKVIKYLKGTVGSKLRYEEFRMGKAELVVFADGSHATNPDGSSQLRYLIFLTDKEN